MRLLSGSAAPGARLHISAKLVQVGGDVSRRGCRDADVRHRVAGHDRLRVHDPAHEVSPVKLNYDLLGNSVPHLHTQIVPRYADDPRPGWPFPFPDPDPAPMPEARLEADLAALRRALTG